jgi:K+-transporting ATPase A subunit
MPGLAPGKTPINIGVRIVRFQIDALIVIVDGIAVLAQAGISVATLSDRDGIVQAKFNAPCIVFYSLLMLP